MKGFLLSVSLLFVTAFSASGQKTNSLLIDAALLKLKNAKEYTLQMARQMPAEYYAFKPTPEQMTYGAQLLHICSNLAWLSSSYLGGGKNPVSKEDAAFSDKENILAVINKTYDFAIGTLGNFDTQQLADTVSFFAGPMNKLQIINLLSDHQVHHQGQLIVYLRLKGIKPPAYVGW